MLFDFLFRGFRRGLQSSGGKHYTNPIGDDNEGESFDLDNPFPDSVTIEFGDVIDLHSIPPRQVRAVVEDFIEDAHRRGLTCARIVHGKGIGVQRELVRSILERTSFVADFRDAPADAGGWGATVVTLSVDESKLVSRKAAKSRKDREAN